MRETLLSNRTDKGAPCHCHQRDNEKKSSQRQTEVHKEEVYTFPEEMEDVNIFDNHRGNFLYKHSAVGMVYSG